MDLSAVFCLFRNLSVSDKPSAPLLPITQMTGGPSSFFGFSPLTGSTTVKEVQNLKTRTGNSTHPLGLVNQVSQEFVHQSPSVVCLLAKKINFKTNRLEPERAQSSIGRCWT